MPNQDNHSDPSIKLMAMFLQDPTLTDLHEDYSFPLEEDYLSGTSSSKFAIEDSDEWDFPLFATLDWSSDVDLSFEHFEQAGPVDSPQFHQVNVFAVLDHTLRAVEEEIGHEIEWRGGGPLIVRPHAFEGANAYYSSYEPSLNFGYFRSMFRRTPVWTCLSHDVIAHELGHAILDNFRPLFYDSHLDTGALHESFGDIMALFSALEHPCVVEHLYRETGGDIFHPSLITRGSEEFGVGLNGVGVPYLRSALEGPAYSIVFDEVLGEDYLEPHARSIIWTAAIYEIMGQLVMVSYPDGFADNEEGKAQFIAALTEAVRWVKGMFFRMLHYMPPTDVTLPMVARLMIAADAHVFGDDDLFRNVAQEVFVRRGLWNEELNLSAPDIGEELRQVQDQDSSRLARVVMQHADELRIPSFSGVRLLTPRLLTTTRHSDKLTQDGEQELVAITQHYLEYAYEFVEMVKDWQTGEEYPLFLRGGGTLVMDEQWQSLLLSTYPEVYEEDMVGPEEIQHALTRAYRNLADVRRLAQFTPNANDRQQVNSAQSKLPYAIQTIGKGGYRLVRRHASLQEHYRALTTPNQARRL